MLSSTTSGPAAGPAVLNRRRNEPGVRAELTVLVRRATGVQNLRLGDSEQSCTQVNRGCCTPPRGIGRLSPDGIGRLSPDGIGRLSPDGIDRLSPDRIDRLSSRRGLRTAGVPRRQGSSTAPWGSAVEDRSARRLHTGAVPVPTRPGSVPARAPVSNEAPRRRPASAPPPSHLSQSHGLLGI